MPRRPRRTSPKRTICVITARAKTPGGVAEYKLTPSGEELRDVVMSLGIWGQRWIESSVSLKNLNPSLLMWDMRRNILPTSIPNRIPGRRYNPDRSAHYSEIQ